jgi:hypothetical protein
MTLGSPAADPSPAADGSDPLSSQKVVVSGQTSRRQGKFINVALEAMRWVK